MIKLGGIVDLKGMKIQPGQVVSDPYARAFAPMKEETIKEEDHEVNMASGQLDYIIKSANELKSKMGMGEKNLPGWIQDHISKAHSYLHQANSGYHELGEQKLNEKRSVAAIQKDFTKVIAAIASELEKYKSVKGTPKAKDYIANLKKLNAQKEKLESEMDYVVSNIYVDAEYQGESIKEAKKYDIGSGYMGNGLTIWNRAEEEHGDYKIIAHISPQGKLSVRDKQLPADLKKMFQLWADSMAKGNMGPKY